MKVDKDLKEVGINFGNIFAQQEAEQRPFNEGSDTNLRTKIQKL